MWVWELSSLVYALRDGRKGKYGEQRVHRCAGDHPGARRHDQRGAAERITKEGEQDEEDQRRELPTRPVLHIRRTAEI